MSTPRLPIPGSDDGTWGGILNDFLSVEHNADGSLKRAAAITDAQTKADSAVQTVNGKAATNGAVTLAAADVSAVSTTQVGTASGVASLDNTGHIPTAQVPDLSGTYVSLNPQSLTAAQQKQAAANIAAWPLQQAGAQAVGPAQMVLLNLGGPGAGQPFPNDQILFGGSTGNLITGRIPIGIIRGNDPANGGPAGNALLSYGSQKADKSGIYYSWQTGLDASTNDYCTFSNWPTAPGDSLRISPGGRFVLGTQIGSPDGVNIQGQVNIFYEKTINPTTLYGLAIEPDVGTTTGITPLVLETYDATNASLFLTSANSRGTSIKFKSDYTVGNDHANANVKDFYIYNQPSSYYDLILDNLDNWNFGGMTPPSGLTRGFTFKDGVAATANPVGGFSMVSIAGVPHFRTSGGAVIQLQQGTVSGSRGGNAALASLLTALAATGLIIDGSTA